jgi:hypothetical protein
MRLGLNRTRPHRRPGRAARWASPPSFQGKPAGSRGRANFRASSQPPSAWPATRGCGEGGSARAARRRPSEFIARPRLGPPPASELGTVTPRARPPAQAAASLARPGRCEPKSACAPTPGRAGRAGGGGEAQPSPAAHGRGAARRMVVAKRPAPPAGPAGLGRPDRTGPGLSKTSRMAEKETCS